MRKVQNRDHTWQWSPADVIKAVVDEEHRHNGNTYGPSLVCGEASLASVGQVRKKVANINPLVSGEEQSSYRQTSDDNVTDKHAYRRSQPEKSSTCAFGIQRRNIGKDKIPPGQSTIDASFITSLA